MKKALILLLTLFFTILMTVSCRETTEVFGTSSVETYLLFGMDDAAENTDVLLLVTVNPYEKILSCIQLPRDTYYNFGGAQNKINQVFASCRAKGQERTQAADVLCDTLQNALGVPIRGYVGITTSALRNTVDALGGIRMELFEDFVFDDGTEEGTIFIPKGENVLDGKTAEKFVRFRKAYKRGDLGRLDAQKIFLSSLIKTAKSADALTLISVAGIVQKAAVSNLSVAEFAKNYLQNRGLYNSLSMTYATMPGEAMLSETGLSYYVLNRKGTLDVLRKSTGTTPDFDPEGRFVNLSDERMVNIFFDKNADETEYRDDTLGQVRIL